MRREIGFLVQAGLIAAVRLSAQSTGLPSFNAPYRAFQRSEFGGVLSFPNPGGTAFEGATFPTERRPLLHSPLTPE